MVNRSAWYSPDWTDSCSGNSDKPERTQPANLAGVVDSVVNRYGVRFAWTSWPRTEKSLGAEAATRKTIQLLGKSGDSMPLYKHRFETVEQYLHHRPPYLLVDRVQAISATEVITERTVRGDEFFLAGHFPGAPIFPGAMLQELTTQSAGILIAAEYNPMREYNTADPHFNDYALGVLVRVHQARYKSFARPGDKLTVRVTLEEQVDSLFDFRASVSVGEEVIMRNAFQLSNIKSSLLIG